MQSASSRTANEPQTCKACEKRPLDMSQAVPTLKCPKKNEHYGGDKDPRHQVIDIRAEIYCEDGYIESTVPGTGDGAFGCVGREDSSRSGEYLL